MKFTPEQLIKAKQAASAEELLALAKENGIELTEEEAKKYFAEWHKEGELADEELDNVSGGSCLDPTPDPYEPERSDVNGYPTVRSTEDAPCGWARKCGNCQYFEKCNTGFKDHDGICTKPGVGF